MATTEWLTMGLAIAHFCICSGFAIYHLKGSRRIVDLAQWTPKHDATPSVSVVVAARNEERHIERAVTALLRQDYPQWELVVVDDRSTDRTPQILADLAARFPSLRVVRIDRLPEGWLGKNHALQVGAEATTGDLVLFTDADVVMDPTLLRRAVAYFEENKLDHLTLMPLLELPGLLLEVFGLVFATFFAIFFHPWDARRPESRAYIGIGAFNLLRRSAYMAVGGHAPIRMRPDDDLMLGKLIKSRGYRQDLVNGVSLSTVPWYGSLGEVIRGLEKNAFAGVNYSIPVTVAGTLTSLLLYVLPFVGIGLPVGGARWVYLATAAVIVLQGLAGARQLRLRPVAALLFPVGVLLLTYIQWRTMVVTLVRGGIRWRGTFYRLEELKANQV